jgi:hypothetical protein
VIPPAPLPPQPNNPAVTTAAPQPRLPGTITARYYAAIPAAAPSAIRPFEQHVSPHIIATRAYLSADPPQQPPTPTTAPPVAAPAAEPGAWARDGNQVEFTVEVIEDLSGSLAEFPKLRDGLMMVSDSDATLAAVRIMEKQKLVKRLAAPRLKCAVGEQATLCVAADTDNKRTETALTLNIKGHGTGQGFDGMHMHVVTEIELARDRRRRHLQIGFQIEEGRTAIVRTHHQPSAPIQAEDEHPVYIVLTPKLVK